MVRLQQAVAAAVPLLKRANRGGRARHRPVADAICVVDSAPVECPRPRARRACRNSNSCMTFAERTGSADISPLKTLPPSPPPWTLCPAPPAALTPTPGARAQARADALVEVCRLALRIGELPDSGG